VSYRSPYDSTGTDLADRLTPGVRSLILANGVVFLLQQVFRNRLETLFGLVPNAVFAHGEVWQLLTYMFLHGGLFHLLFNMLALFMFGSDIERDWGTREFLKYYFVTGVGAGLTQWAVSMNSDIPTIGASGAIFGILLAFGMLYPNRPILLYFILPVPAKYLVVLFGFIEVVAVAGGGGRDGVARFAHLGGLLFGFLYLKSERFSYPFRRWWGSRKRRIRLASEAQEDRKNESEREKIDAILDKISRLGMGSLTRQERKTLEEAGRRGRNVRGG
jgi:membrane associated rhomboid family serine protease